MQIPGESKGHIEDVPMKSPEEGRKLLANARIVALSFQDTDLPIRPLLLLDAMTMGKPIVVTNYNGS